MKIEYLKKLEQLTIQSKKNIYLSSHNQIPNPR